ncbi:MAG: peptidase family protein [Candidatus Saccharibacteria bacterium]|nr:peptidase family protein [Candidatus Saccharibacteria bacterium]
MRRRQKRVTQNLFPIVIIPIMSLCVTLILLYILMPGQHNSQAIPIHAPKVVNSVTAPAVVIASPVQLNIDSINVNAIVNPVGLTSTGDMDIDENPTQVAWYKLGPKPGEVGSAVIAGHYGWKDGVPSVFNDLNKLVKGDTISTVGEDGQVKTFAVNHTALYAPDQDATNVFTSDDGKAHLNLVTCQGSWNNSARTYTERLIVFTDYVK